jgi:hypothetical protein
MENTTPKQSTLSTDDRIFKTPTMPYVHSNSGPMYHF